jgi:hypothetical protein
VPSKSNCKIETKNFNLLINSQLEPAAIVEPPLRGFQVMLIVCAIFFLSLVLLGLAASYYCLSRRRVAVIRRRPMTLSLAGSDITKMSESSISMFEGLKIPRATVTPIGTLNLVKS